MEDSRCISRLSSSILQYLPFSTLHLSIHINHNSIGKPETSTHPFAMPNKTNSGDLETQSIAFSATLISSSDSADSNHEGIEATDAGSQTCLGIEKVGLLICYISGIYANNTPSPTAWSRPLRGREPLKRQRRRAARLRGC
jgi:hypothetical protein